MRARVDEVRARLTIVDDVAVARLEAAGWTCLPPGTAADRRLNPWSRRSARNGAAVDVGRVIALIGDVLRPPSVDQRTSNWPLGSRYQPAGFVDGRGGGRRYQTRGTP